MSDVILYASIAENQRLLRDYIYTQVNPGAPLSIDYFADNNIGVTYNCWDRELSQCPAMVQYWQRYLTPFTAARSNGFKVCDTSGYFRCGASCSWTVPAGVTEVQFQLWGHGGGNSGQCCCGGSPWGPTGSYMVANVPVTPGETFCLYAGCAYCCYASQTTPGYSNEQTCVYSVSTPDLAMYAYGAVPEYQNWCSSAPSGTVNWSSCGPITRDGCNPNSCSGWNFCWDDPQDNVCIPHMFDTVYKWCVNCNTRGISEAYGLPAIYPALSIGSCIHSNAYHISPPVFGFENCTCCLTGTNVNYQVGGCCYKADAGYQQIPAVGGYAKWICGGYDACPGDAGGMGMVCVSWNC